MEIINTTDYDKDTVLRFQQFNARIVKSIPWSTHALFAFLMLSVLAGAFFAVRSHAWLYLAVLALALYVFGRRFTQSTLRRKRSLSNPPLRAFRSGIRF